jgi:HTH-type transcriptional regulator / antitoxin HipB
MIVKTVDELAEVARARRHELGLTQEELAGVIGVHRMFVSQFESGKRSMRLELVLRLVQALGLDVDLRPRDR